MQDTPTLQIAELLMGYRENPVAFVEEVIGVKPTEQQEQLLNAIRWPDARVSVRSGHGVGKTSSLAWTILWFLLTHQEKGKSTRILCTAPGKTQMFDNLWSEVHKWADLMVPTFKQYIEITQDKVFIKGYKNTKYAAARTARKETPEALQGHHADFMLVIADEASGIDEKVFELGQGTLTSKGSRVILISNPTRTEGYFYDSQTVDADQWTVFKFSCLDSPNVDPEYGPRMVKKYGENSSVYKVRVLGEFPSASDDTIIPLNLVEEAIDRPITPAGGRVAGLDVARFGDDANAFLINQGGVITDVQVWRNTDLMETVGKVVHIYDRGKGFDKICVDVIGLGAGVVDRLRELGVPVVAVNVSESTAYKEKFHRLRDELWWDLREAMQEKVISIPKDLEHLMELKKELIVPRYGFHSTGKLKVESKEDMKKRNHPSPNIADALCLTLFKGGRVKGKRRAKKITVPSWGGWV